MEGIQGPEIGPYHWNDRRPCLDRSTDALEIKESYALIPGVEHRCRQQQCPFELARSKGQNHPPKSRILKVCF